jgi:rod shape-determining protein MreD
MWEIDMSLGFLNRLDILGRRLLPGITLLVLVFLAEIPIPLPGYGTIAPELPLMAIFYWGIYRPDLLRSWFILAVGLLQDLLGGGAFGVSALVFLVTWQVVSSQRRLFVGQPFLTLWWGFSVVMLVVAVVGWAFHSLLQVTVLPFSPAFFQALMSLALYPFFAVIFILLQRALLTER